MFQFTPVRQSYKMRLGFIVLYKISYLMDLSNEWIYEQLLTPVAHLAEHKAEDLRRTCWP